MRRFLGIVVLAFAASVSSSAQAARSIAEAVIPSVALLVMTDGQGQPLSLGSGFVVRPGIIATNLHVIQGASGGSVRFTRSASTSSITGIVAIDHRRDLVLLQVHGPTPTPLPFAIAGSARIGDPIFAVGNPAGLEGTFSQGIVSGIRAVAGDTLLQITAPISPGSSGGPIVNGQGQVVGVAVATLRAGQSLNFGIPHQYVQALLEKVVPATKLVPELVKGNESGLSSVIAGRLRDGVLITLLQWEPDYTSTAWWNYGFSIRNTLGSAVTHVRIGIIWWTRDGQPVHYVERTVRAIVPPGLAFRLTDLSPSEIRGLAQRMEVRVLDFHTAP